MIKKSYLIEKFEEIDKIELTTDSYDGAPDERLNNFTKNYIEQECKAILGLDIYKYSEFDEDKQALIPFIFDLLLDGASGYLSNDEPSLFKNYRIKENFISTGDGAFIIFPTPLHALLFNLHFSGGLHMYNSGHLMPKLFNYLGDLTIRSTITYDRVFNYENNWFGKGIIKNARILSMDKLNRFIIDKETYNYFMNKFNGIETLSIINRERIIKIMGFDENFETCIFDENSKNIFKNIHVQKIDDILSKTTKLIIYNIEIQFQTDLMLGNQPISFIYSIGNSNAIHMRQ
jgi:hypothetical protein